MTLALAAAGMPNANHAPIIAAGNERLIVCTIDACMFLSMNVIIRESAGLAPARNLPSVYGLNSTDNSAGQSNIDCPQRVAGKKMPLRGVSSIQFNTA
jgi:hypothetical protein